MGMNCDWHLIRAGKQVAAYVTFAAPCHDIHTCTRCMIIIRSYYQQSWNCPHCGVNFTWDQVTFQ